MKILIALQSFFESMGVDKTYWIAYSGGLDSHVLLHACAFLKSRISIRLNVIHINHNLSAQAKDWEVHCQRMCAEYGLVLTVDQLHIEKQQGDSLEEIARIKRYDIFRTYLNHNNVLLTAHHQDDQAETLLLQLFRGAGIAGLAAMPEVKEFAKGWHARPLLNFSRQDLHQYAIENQLKWLEDESNQALNLRRNFIRHAVLPLLRQQLPTVSSSIARSAGLCAQAQDLLQEWAQELLQKVQGTQPQTLSVKKLLEFKEVKQSLILRAWIKQQGYILPSAIKIQTIKNTVLKANADKTPCVEFGNTELRRYQDDLYLMPRITQNDIQQVFDWDLSADLCLPNVGRLQCIKQKGGIKKINKVNVCFRVGGEVIHVNGQHRRLKNCLQDWKIPVWKRNNLPLIFYENKLICVPNYYVDTRFRVKDDEDGLSFLLKN